MEGIEDGIAGKIEVTLEERPMKELAASSKWEDLYRDYNASITARFNAANAIKAALGKDIEAAKSATPVSKPRNSAPGL
jgi:hypothetical protein